MRHDSKILFATMAALTLALGFAMPVQATVTARLYAGNSCGGAAAARFNNDGVTRIPVSLCVTTQTPAEGLCSFTFVPIGVTATDSDILQIVARTFSPTDWSQTNEDPVILPFTIPAAAYPGSDLGSGKAIFNSSPLPVGENLISTFDIVVPTAATLSQYAITLDTNVPALSTGSVGPDGLCISEFQFDDSSIILQTAPRFTLVNSTISAPLTFTALSRKQHADAGSFDMPIDQAAETSSSAITVEPRRSEAGDTHRLVFNFDQPISSIGSVQLSGIAGSELATGFADSPLIEGNSVSVSLHGVADRKRLKVTLTDINGVSNANATVSIGFLFGDVTQNLTASQSFVWRRFVPAPAVTAVDVIEIAARSPSAVNAENFFYDVLLMGDITALDAVVVAARSPIQLE